MNTNESTEQPIACIQVTDAIRDQGIDDLTSLMPVQFMFTIVYSCLFAMGLAGNGGVILAVSRNKRLWSARNIFLLNLIFTDLLLCLTSTPVTPLYALSKEWRLGSLMCHAMPLSNSCAVFVTSWSLCAIALDKFLHIIDSTREPFSVRFAVAMTVLIWIICSLINIPYLMSYELVDGSYYVPKNATPFCGRFCDEINWSGETERRLYGSTVMLLQFVVPMGIITWCYWRILAKVHKDMIITNVQFSQSLTTNQRIDAIKRKRRVNYILIAMVLAFIGCWLPMTAVNLAKDFKTEPAFIRTQPYLWPLIAHVIAMSTIVWNPLLFFWLTRSNTQKRSNFGGIMHTSEIIVNSLTSRMQSLRSQSHRSQSGHSGSNEMQHQVFKRRQQMTANSAEPVRRRVPISAAAAATAAVDDTASSIRIENNNSILYQPTNKNNNDAREDSCSRPLLTTRPLLLRQAEVNGDIGEVREGQRAAAGIVRMYRDTSPHHCLIRKSVSMNARVDRVDR